jgi:hypothetical protein
MGSGAARATMWKNHRTPKSIELRKRIHSDYPTLRHFTSDGSAGRTQHDHSPNAKHSSRQPPNHSCRKRYACSYLSPLHRNRVASAFICQRYMYPHCSNRYDYVRTGHRALLTIDKTQTTDSPPGVSMLSFTSILTVPICFLYMPH